LSTFEFNNFKLFELNVVIWEITTNLQKLPGFWKGMPS